MKEIYVVEYEKYVELSNGKSFFREINYSTVKDSYTVEKFDNFNDAKDFYDDIKFNLKMGEGYSLSVINHDENNDWYYETLDVFNYQDLQNEKKYELHLINTDSKEDKGLFINDIENFDFYREDSQELSFENNFNFNQYSLSDDELIVIVKRLEPDKFEIVQIITD